MMKAKNLWVIKTEMEEV